MYTMNLSFEQQNALVDILECSISEIHSQIVHAENHCFKIYCSKNASKY